MKRYIIILILTLISCQKKENIIQHYDIYKLDNEYVLRNDKMQFIDSLLEIYPRSNYVNCLKVIELARSGNPRGAIDYHNSVQNRPLHLKSFVGVGFDVAMFSFDDSFLEETDSTSKDFIPMTFKELFEAIEQDKEKINLWGRFYLALIYDRIHAIEEANYYFQEAYNLNPKNAELLYYYAEFLIRRYNNFHYSKELLNDIPNYFYPKSVRELKNQINENINSIN